MNIPPLEAELLVTEVNREFHGGVMSMRNVKKLETSAIGHVAQIYFKRIALHVPQYAAIAQSEVMQS